jgi:integrase
MSTVGTADALTLAEAQRIVQAAMRDNRYRETPLGTLVARFIRWFRNEYGASPATIRDYEATLARMALTLPTKQPYEVDIEDLRGVIDLWSDRRAGTRAKVTSHIRSFWDWAEEQGHIAISPAARIRRPRGERRVAGLLPGDAKPRLLSQSKEPRDRLALMCLLALGLRRSELAGIQVRDFDAHRGSVRVFGKGRKERRLPLRGPILDELRLYLSADLPHLGRPPEPDDYLIYPVRKLTAGKGSEGQPAFRYVADPKKRPGSTLMHRWWYRQLQDAGLVGHDITSGMHMHLARHSFAQELRRIAGIDAASQALGHSDLSTTLSIYGHRDESDLEIAMNSYADYLTANVPPEEET